VTEHEGDGFDGCTRPPAWVARARAAFSGLPAAVAQHADLPRWLVRDIRHYWSVALREDEAETYVRKRDVDAVLAAIARLERALEGLPYNSLSSVEADRIEEESSAATNGVLVLLSAGLGSRRDDYLTFLGEMATEIRRRLGRKQRPGPRRDLWRRELEDHVALDLLQAGVKLTMARTGILAKTLVTVYQAAGIQAPQQDSLFRTLKRLVDWHNRLALLARGALRTL